MVSVSKKDKEKMRKHAASEIKSHPVDAVGSPEIPGANTPVKKKKKRSTGQTASPELREGKRAVEYF